MNTRLQVEHPVTEAIHPGLDLVELMIRQGIAQHASAPSSGGLTPTELNQAHYDIDSPSTHAVEVRVYCENPSAGFKPAPGVLQYVHFPSGDGWEWLRTDTWVESGTTVTPYFDPLVAKIIVSGPTREVAISNLHKALAETKICGPPNNSEYLRSIVANEVWSAGRATTTFLNNFKFTPRYGIVVFWKPSHSLTSCLYENQSGRCLERWNRDFRSGLSRKEAWNGHTA